MSFDCSSLRTISLGLRPLRILLGHSFVALVLAKQQSQIKVINAETENTVFCFVFYLLGATVMDTFVNVIVNVF